MADSIPLAEISRRIAEIDEKLACVDRLKVERDVLAGLLVAAGESTPNGSDPLTYETDGGIVVTDRRPGPTESIIALLKARPGLRPSEIAEALHHRIASAARDRRNVLRTTAAKLVNDGVLRRDDDNRMFIVEGGDA